VRKPAPAAGARPIAAVDRRHRILERVAEEQTIHVGELARVFDVSEMTIRRDIRKLERDGFVRQTYGGATAHLTRALDVAFNARALRHTREKRRIGMRATRLLGDARVIFVGIGTTAEQFARFLPARQGLVAVTASLPIASLLGTRPLDVVTLGGTVRHDELTCVGPVAAATLARFRFDLAVVGAAGLSAHWGLTELDDAEAEIQRIAIERADRLVVIADGSKIGTAANAVVAEAARIRTLVTDAGAPGDELAALAALGVEIVIAGTTDDAADAPADGAGPG
jgi:DeoR family transcriptional regulator of aga operon/DeoR family fructose operon transcriptional repressor